MSSNNTTLTLHYFDIQARGEAAYLIAVQGGVHVERNLFEDLASDLKSVCPFGQVPLLEIKIFAKKASLIPEDDFDQSVALQYVLGVDEFRSGVYKAYYSGKEASAAKKEWKEGAMIQHLSRFEGFLEKAVDSDHLYLVGGKLSWADIVLYDALVEQAFMLEEDNLWSKYPRLLKAKQNVETLPNIAKYLESGKQPALYIEKWRK
ncbi:hypothetical protein C9374_000051 [Naegleria lovaniensis]|uniref:GST C-terminal domain-containing protein n=1 Tax=Naegleria lovaniensis TaxID=51637 RepID=A0AA88GTI9_NAELO|nr:uncharacterized protein C9374_000051 [Naegleria lovaniensis]KAG2388612.1 hypothetical protein C9374_000051 [Naegleria lovaniensis]